MTRALAERYGVKPSRALGQNFCVDPNTISRIVRLAEIKPDDDVVEVGAGLGALTIGLSRSARSVVALEVDRHLIPALEETLDGLSNVTLIHADAMNYPFDFDRPHRFVGNLPYNIATPLILRLLESAPSIADFTVMVQEEVAQRLAASPGSRLYGSPSVACEYFCTRKILGRFSPTVFWPRPRVSSALVLLTRRASTSKSDFSDLMRVVRAAFAQRRKLARNSIASALAIAPLEVETAMMRAGLDSRRRAETLSLSEFDALTQNLNQ